MAIITVVEDDPNVARLIAMTLEDEDHEVTVCMDGAKGLQSILGSPPDLAVLDVNLPNMSGFDIAENIRGSAEISALPILMLTAQSDLDSRLRGLASADDYLNKPFDPEELEARIAALLRRSSMSPAKPPKKPVDALAGEQVRYYDIIEEFGRGNMSIVYRAVDTKLERTVALKFFTKEFKDSEKQVRFIREAQAASRLVHPNICTVYTVDETDHGQPFMVMPFLEGMTLEERINQGTMKIGRAVNYAVQTARGLSAAHIEGIVHRDIKPANLFIETDGVIKILDFGVAKWTLKADETNTTQEGTLVGTVNYMSPEQVRGKEVDARSDIWAIGVVLYEMLTGIKPFSGSNNIIATISAISTKKPEPIASLRSGVPTDVENIVMRALEKRPADRYQNINEMLRDLRALYANRQQS
ncbi:MAG: protein kinase [Deinococcota bacterium]